LIIQIVILREGSSAGSISIFIGNLSTARRKNIFLLEDIFNFRLKKVEPDTAGLGMATVMERKAAGGGVSQKMKGPG
jgi:hypothetical protein